VILMARSGPAGSRKAVVATCEGMIVGSDDWVPAGIDTDRPSSARIYDYWLGGAHNFAADRRVAEQMLAAYPEGQRIAWANRAFLRRAVEFLVDAGVRQFLDIGSGVPTVGHVHDIAQGAAPESRVVFVDIDPVAVAHSRLILKGNDGTAVVQEDIRRPEQILDAPEMQLLDLDQPVAVLVVALFHFISDADDPAGIVSRLTAPLVSGSYLALSHATDDGPQDTATGKEIYRRAGIEFTLRSRSGVEALFDGFDLVEPGVVWMPLWHPESPDDPYYHQPELSLGYAGVGRKP
jgi:SAM-dependent methyltransferase